MLPSPMNPTAPDMITVSWSRIVAAPRPVTLSAAATLGNAWWTAVVLVDQLGATGGGESGMAMYWKEITVNWGESDPFGLVYYPRIVAWFNDTEHELFRIIGYPIEQMIKNDRTTFVMGEIHFRFIGPAAYGDRIVTTITLAEIGERTLHWNCKAKNAVSGAPVSEGKATRVYARINEDGTLSSQPIPTAMLDALRELGDLKHLRTNSGPTRLAAER
jgi:acyl-CoA thioesterase FadM